MSHDGRPYVAIVGGFYHLAPEKAAEAKMDARKFGAALAEAGMGLVVYFSDDNSLEPHVVAGYVEALPEGDGHNRIRVRYAQSQKGKVRFAEQDTHEDVFDAKLFGSKNWEAPFYRSLVEADGVDAVLLMAGNHSTRIAGQIALARPLPVLAVDLYEGAAAEIWSELASGSDSHPSSATTPPRELVEGLKAQTATRTDRITAERRRENLYRRMTSQGRKSVWAAFAFAALMVTVIVGTTQTVTPTITFIGLITAGATGALIRSVWWGLEGTHPFTTLLLGGIAGFLVGVAYLIPQWMGSPDQFMANGNQATVRMQFISVLLVAVPGGVGFDTVFTRIRNQASELPVTPGQ